MACLACGQGLHEECTNVLADKECCEATSLCLPDIGGLILDIESDSRRTNGNGRRGPYKADADVVDPLSTGRKRAHELYPINPEEPCEWQGRANVGGGKHPIVGCIEGLQQTTQHGPDKNTLNNSPENIHRICHKCHNLWHYHNDGDYDPAGPFDGEYAHNPRIATPLELVNWDKKETRPKAAVPRAGTFTKKVNEDDLPAMPGEETPVLL